LTPAALDGIAAHGLRWRYEIKLSDLTSRLGRDDIKVGDGETILAEIGRRLSAFVSRHARTLTQDEAYIFTTHAEEIVEVDDDLDEIKAALNRLYDDFDFHRICAI
jgi:hypothetical protein